MNEILHLSIFGGIQKKLWQNAASGSTIVLMKTAFSIEQLMHQTLDWIGQLGSWGPIIFILLFIVATVCFIPGSFMTLGAGALFGVVSGSIYVSIGSTLGATCAFLIGRYFARDAVTRKFSSNPKFAAIDKIVADEGWKIVTLTRLSPAFPFFLLNYALGLTRVKFRHYVFASWLGMLPGTITYVYLGSLAQIGAGRQPRTTLSMVFYGIGLLATIAITVYMMRLARKALSQKIGDSAP